MGTPGYMAPEQARGESVDERADVHALGALLHHVLAGAIPPAPLDPALPFELSTIVRKATAAAAAERYPTAKAFGDDLQRFLTGQLVSAHAYSAWASRGASRGATRRCSR